MSSQIKVVATDMDGTFLNSLKDYDRPLFDQLFKRMQEQQIKFIVASGNQYAQLRAFFLEKDDEIAFVSDNGSQIFEHGKLVSWSTLDTSVVQQILAYAFALPSLKHVTLSGLKSAYILDSASDFGKKNAHQYYYNLTEVPDFAKVDDQIGKLNLMVEDSQKDLVTAEINQRFPGAARAVTSGHSSIDIIVPHINKAIGIKYLMNAWQLDQSSLIAFGDQNNDLEMLEYAGIGVAMANSSAQVLAVANEVTKTSDENGVLEFLAKLI